MEKKVWNFSEAQVMSGVNKLSWEDTYRIKHRNSFSSELNKIKRETFVLIMDALLSN